MVSPWRVIAIATSDTNVVTSPGSSVLTASCVASKRHRSIVTSEKSIPPKESGSSIWSPNKTYEHHRIFCLVVVYYYDFERNNKRYLHIYFPTWRLSVANRSSFRSFSFRNRLPMLRARLLINYVIRYEYNMWGRRNFQSKFPRLSRAFWNNGCLFLWYFAYKLCQMRRAAL